MKNRLILFLVFLSSCNILENKLKDLSGNMLNLLGYGDKEKFQVLTSYPSESGYVNRQDTISLQFNREISPRSCMSAFNLQPALPGNFTVQLNSLTFKPFTEFVPGLTYVLSLGKSCEDKSGNDLNETFVLTFQVAGDTSLPELLTISTKREPECNDNSVYTQVYPTEDNNIRKGLCKNTSFRFAFSKSMNPDSVELSLQFQPALTGSYAWSENNRMLEFQPAFELRNAMNYFLAISKEAMDSIKNPLKDNIRFSFQVGRDINPPEIILLDGYKKDGQSCKPGKLYSETEALGLSDKIGLCSSLYPNSDNSPIYIHFSENIDSSSLESAFQIQPFINGIKHWKNSHHPSCGKSGDCSEKSLLVFTPSVPWEHGKTYVISLDTSLQDTVGNFLKDSYTTHFTIGTDFKKPRLLRWGMRLNLGSGDCENSDITFFEPDTEGKIIRFIPCKGKSALILEFSEDINPLHFIKNLKISPAFSFQHEWGKASHSDCGSTGHCGNYSRIQITPHENYSNEEIQIQLSNALLDPETNPAETDYSIYFATSPDTESPFLDLDRGAVFADYDTECKGLAFTNISNNEKGICSLAGGIKFKFVFTEAMEESSVLRSFSIQPAVKGIFKKESADTFSFFPTESLVTFQQYKLQFSTEAKDLSGKNLRENFSFSFITGDGTGSMDVTNPSLISVRADAERDPGSCDGKAEMDLLSNDAADDICSFNLNEVLKGPIITFQFSEEMNKDSVLQALHISPSVSGNINWLSSSSLEYRIDKPLQQGIGYEIELTKDAKDIKGNPLNQDFYKLFRVSEYKLSPKVISITGKTASLSDCNKDLYTLKTLNTTTPVSGFCTKENRSFLFDFSEDMDKLSLESYLKLSPFIPLNFTWISAQELEIKPATELQYGQIYSFRLSSEIKDIQGQYMNPAEYSFIAGELDSTKPNLSCSNCGLFLELNEDADGCSNSEADDIQVKDSAIVNKVCRTQTLKLNFSEEIDLNSFTSSFSVSPYFSFSTYQEGTSVYIRALNPLEENTQFEIQLQNSLRDLSGNTLDKAYRFTFQTEQTSPEVIGIGLESQSNCSDINSEGSPIGGDWFMTNCFWKRPSPILSGSSYLFHGGNAVCGTDSKSDNIRIIFSKPMNIHSSISSISLKRISPPQSFIQKASWKWTDSNRVLTLKFSEDLASCSGNQPGSFDLSFNPQDSLTEYPFYLLEIDKSAEDEEGNRLYKTFYFTMEGN